MTSTSTGNYVIHADIVWDERDWEESGYSEKYDDVIHCIVDYDHPDYNEDTFEQEMCKWWSVGIKPPYAKRN